MPSTESHSTKRTENGAAETARSSGSPSLPDRAVFSPGKLRSFVFKARPHLLPGLRLPARRGLLVLSSLGLLALCSLLLLHRSGPGPVRPGFDLRAEDSSSKLNDTSAEAPPAMLPAALPSELDMRSLAVKEETAGTPAAQEPVAQTTLELAPQVPAPPALPVVLPELPPHHDLAPVLPAAAGDVASENCYAIRTPQRGDTPMMRTWRSLGLQSVLVAALTAPAFAGQTDGTKPEDKSETVLKELRDLKKEVGDLKKHLEGKVENLDTGTSLKLAKAQMDLEELRKQVAQMRRDLEDMTKNRQSLYAAVPPVATGTIQLRNTFGEMVLILVNNRPYRVLPGQTIRTDPVPAGSFSYEVVGIQPQLLRTLTANETYTIHVYPR